MLQRQRKRTLAIIGAFLVTATLAFAIPASQASAQAACGPAWNSATAYTGGAVVSYNGSNWTAQWWTQGETPGTTGEWGVWRDQVPCGGSGGDTGGGDCSFTVWSAGADYQVGDVVLYSDGNYYVAVHANPGYDPTISTWFWDPTSCDGGTTDPPDPPDPSGFVVSETQFNQMFPGRNSFYTYQGLVEATASYPGFANTGGDTVSRQEAAAFLANIGHETGGLVYIVEQNTGNYSHYCDANQPYGCPAGQSAYYGRGPMQLSWNFNYNAAGNALGLPLLTNPWLVEQNSTVAWQTALWYWNTQSGPGTMSGHTAMTTGAGFGESIRSINGAVECDGGNPAQVQSRVTKYQQFASLLGVPTGGNLYC
ncbi:glycoside hydrolase family 19 protein [Glycomyces arizonensis]|uniref:glycoside hydrolase family 19 protein n=1 Tax=Glycomyces arizonensis TaxID=256035 RepID=UPI0004048083|nr:glycoside hydrolase family 19 protein [Glycomyces arizonensis]